MSDVLRDAEDPVVRHIVTYNEGYILQELLDGAEAHLAYWTSWRGFCRMMLPILGFDFFCIAVFYILIMLGF